VISNKKLRVIAVEKQPTEVIKISFETLDGNRLNYSAGQFLTLIFNHKNRELRRSYSFCSSPLVEEPITIAVKLVENGEISRLLHHQISIGDEVEITTNGQFVYEPQIAVRRTIFLLGAGVGITPLFSILKTALIAEIQSKVVLIYSSRSADDTLFLQELADWQARYPDQLTVIHLFSKSKKPNARSTKWFFAEAIGSRKPTI
jgi:ring-1,2-phenylacetyl-CoA epoxidase subunit PaaE